MKEKFLPAASQGITLLELLVVIAIIGVLTAIGLASYNDFNKRQQVKATALNLKNDLRVAQTKALSGDKDCRSPFCGGRRDGCGNDIDGTEKALDYWEFSFASGSYTMTGYCGGRDFSPSTVTLPTNVTLTSTVPSIQFKVLGQGVSSASTVCVLGFNKYKYKISVTVSGEIKDEGLVDTCPL